MSCWASVNLALRLSGLLAVDLLAFEGGGGVGECGGEVAQRVGPDSLSDISSYSESAFSGLGLLDLTLVFFSLDVLLRKKFARIRKKFVTICKESLGSVIHLANCIIFGEFVANIKCLHS